MSAFSRLNNVLNRFNRSLSNARELELLATMSDTQLARRGLRRDQIPSHFFGNNRND